MKKVCIGEAHTSSTGTDEAGVAKKRTGKTRLVSEMVDFTDAATTTPTRRPAPTVRDSSTTARHA